MDVSIFRFHDALLHLHIPVQCYFEWLKLYIGAITYSPWGMYYFCSNKYFSLKEKQYWIFNMTSVTPSPILVESPEFRMNEWPFHGNKILSQQVGQGKGRHAECQYRLFKRHEGMKASFNDWVASTRFIVGILFIALEMSSSSVSLAPTLQYNTHLGPAVLHSVLLPRRRFATVLSPPGGILFEYWISICLVNVCVCV